MTNSLSDPTRPDNSKRAADGAPAAPTGPIQPVGAGAPAEDVPSPDPQRVFGGLQPWAQQLLWALAVGSTLGLVLWLAVLAPTVSVPLLIAFIVAYLLDPIVDRLERRGIARAPAIAGILGAFLAFLVAAAFLVVPQLVREFAQVPGALQTGLSRLLPWVEHTLGWRAPENLSQAMALLQEQLLAIDVRALANPAATLARGVYGGTLGALSLLATVVMVPIFSFYLLRDFDDLMARFAGLIPPRYRPPVQHRMEEIDHALSSFIRGQIMVAFILASLYSAGLWAIGLPLAVVVGFAAGLGNMIPYVGTTLGIFLALALALLTPDVLPMVLQVGAIFLVVQFLEGWVITPRIVGESIGLSSFAVIVSVLFFGELFGFVGVLVAVPLTAILKILWRVVLDQYRRSLFFEGRAVDRHEGRHEGPLEPHPDGSIPDDAGGPARA